MVTLDAAESHLSELEAAGAGHEDLNEASEKVELIQKMVSEAFLDVLSSTTSGISVEKKHKESQALFARLTMALGGGLALVAPMLIMVLHSTKLTAILTTSCFVVAVAIALAVFMVDSQPKDVVACTAAYAAVLVVFVGAGGGAGA
jgi:hypothetical protein